MFPFPVVCDSGIHNLQHTRRKKWEFHSKIARVIVEAFEGDMRIAREISMKANKTIINETSFRMSIDIPVGKKIESFITLTRRNLNGWNLLNTKLNNILSSSSLRRASFSKSSHDEMRRKRISQFRLGSRRKWRHSKTQKCGLNCFTSTDHRELD